MRARKPKLTISKKDQKQLETTARIRMEPAGRIQRAEILLMYAEGEKITHIAQKVKAARPLVYRAIDKALAFGVLQSLADLKRSGRSRKTDDSAKTWVLPAACRKPADCGYAAETRTYSQLVQHMQKHAAENGHQCLQKISRSQVYNILNEGEIRPHKIRYYLERRDPQLFFMYIRM